MSLRRLQIFLEVASRGGFAAAADRLGIAQSAVSMQMRALEEELEAELFDRSRRPPSLNDHGRALVPRAREILARYEDLRAAMRSDGGISGTLRLGVIQTVSTGTLPDALAVLRDRHPGLRVRIESGLSPDLTARVTRAEIDAAIITAPDRLPAGLRAQKIFEEPLSVIAPPDAAAGGKAGEKPAESADAALLCRYPFIRFNRRTGVGRIIDHALRDRGIAVDEAMELDAIEPIIEMVSRGLGVAVIPDKALGESLRSRFAIMPFGHPPATRQVVVVERPASPRAALTRVFADMLKALAPS